MGGWKRTGCHDSNGYLESRELLQIAFHSLSAVTTPVNVWGLYCILMKTPKSMRPLKWHLFNLHLWMTVFDLMYGSLITPFFFFPALAGSPSGLMAVAGVPTLVQIFIAFCCFGGVCSAIIFVFENRQYVLCVNTNRFRLKNPMVRAVYYAMVLAYCCLSFYPFSWNVPEQTTAKLRILELIPCPALEFFSSSTYVFRTPEDTAAFAYYGLCFTLFLSSQICLFGGNCFYHLYAIDNVNMSAHSKRLQQKFFVSVCIQISIPTGVVILPLSYFLVSIFYGYYNQSLNNLISLFFLCHGVIATIFLLFMNAPYREFTAHTLLGTITCFLPVTNRLGPSRTSFIVPTNVK